MIKKPLAISHWPLVAAYCLSRKNRNLRLHIFSRILENGLKSKMLVFSALLAACCLPLAAQNVTAPLHSVDEYTIQRLATLYPQTNVHTAIRPYRREDMVKMGVQYLQNIAFSDITKYDVQHIFEQNNEFIDSLNIQSEKPILKHFYITPAHFFEINTPSFYLKANPIINIGLGISQNDNSNLFYNQRGVEIRGGIDKKVFFSTQILESQVRYPGYVNEFAKKVKALPGAGLFKNYQLDLFDVNNGYDFLVSQAYIGFNISKHIGLQFGHGTNFIGDGQRSLILSDFSTPYFYLKLNTRVWKFHYQNIFAELAAAGVRDDVGDKRIPKKYMAAHYLSYKVNTKLTFGIYEAVIFDRAKDQFELQYLNPIIFYRTVEGAIGSPDNALLGATAKWDAFNSISFYGQFVLDDIIVRRVFNGNLGWWGNKFGIQAGANYLNAFGIEHLDAQVEFNSIRPYTYTHRDSSATYSNFNQALAHPLGANFHEILFSIKYRPISKLHLNGKLFLVNTGEDFVGNPQNFGQNILRNNQFRPEDFGNTIGQGDATTIQYIYLSAAYELKHNLFLEVEYGNRNKSTASGGGDFASSWVSGKIRWNLPVRGNFF